jgi:hypothetical protein
VAPPRETGAEFAIFEPVLDAFVSEKSEGIWTQFARNTVKAWACTLASVKKPPSPWAKGPKLVVSEELVVVEPLAPVLANETAGNEDGDATVGPRDGGGCVEQRAGRRRV